MAGAADAPTITQPVMRAPLLCVDCVSSVVADAVFAGAAVAPASSVAAVGARAAAPESRAVVYAAGVVGSIVDAVVVALDVVAAVRPRAASVASIA
jgi:hypothetical protein